MATLQLDRPRDLKWTNRGEYRLGEIKPPVEIADLDHRNRYIRFRTLCCHVWAACLHDDDAFATPDKVADYIDTPDKESGALEALYNTFVEAGRIKKKVSAETST